MITHGQAGDLLVPHSPLYQGFFGRMFRNLPAFDPEGVREEDKVEKLRELGGQMHETQEEADDSSLDNPNIPAGYTYFGQFVDHDITFDPSSSLQRFNDPNKLVNFRTPRFDLDSLYGNGPSASPYLYDQNRIQQGGFVGYLLVGAGENSKEADLPRNVQNRALIGDPRNDENIIVSQMQLAFILFHNQVMDALEQERVTGPTAFAEAQRIVRWHYQWVVINDFLKRLVGEEVLETIVENGLSYYRWRNNPYMPIEFAGAAYRLGHSMIRSKYSLNDRLDRFNPDIPIFLPPRSNPGPLDDLRGNRILPNLWTIQWNRFFEIKDESGTVLKPQLSRRLDTKLAFRLNAIPAGPGGQNSLAILNLLRGWRLGLPSGQSISRAMGIDPVHNPNGDDPAWFYILKEAELNGGEKLGQVGATIVAEVFYGLLAGDPFSYLNVYPNWDPSKEAIVRIIDRADDKDDFQLRDILRFAGAALTRQDIDNIHS